MEMQGLTPRFWLAVSWVALRNLNALQAPQDSKTPALTWWFSALEAYFINKHFMNGVNPDVTPKDSPLVGLVRGSTSAFFLLSSKPPKMHHLHPLSVDRTVMSTLWILLWSGSHTFSSYKSETLSLLSTNLPPAPGNNPSTLCFYDLGGSKY